MNNPVNKLFLGAAALLIIVGCNEIPSENSTQNNDTTSFDTAAHLNAHRKEVENVVVHSVIVEEVLPTSSYVYLYVKEGEKSYWISTSNMEVKPGEAYLFHEVMEQVNFKSKELNRTFDTLYLVSNIVRINSKGDGHMNADPSSTSPVGSVSVEGSMKIADLVANKKAYAGQTVQLSGTCVKINKAIMGRNWIHLQDGSMNDYDLVITSDAMVPVGNSVTMTGVVTLDKDFGASYQYELIIEEGRVLEQD